jgi:hypothetical protein
MREIAELRRAARAFHRPYGYGPRGFGYAPAWGPMMAPGMEMAPPAPPAAEAAAQPAETQQAAAPAPAVEAAAPAAAPAAPAQQ